MRWRDFTLLWSASAASQLGSMCAATANPLLVLLLTHSPVFAGWVGAASTIPALLMYLPAGWFVDHCNRRMLMWASQCGRLVVSALLVWALILGHHSTSVLIAGGLCEGTLLVLYSTAEITAVQRVVSSKELPSALAMNEARSHLTYMAGKPLGGFLFGYGRAVPYFVNVAASIWSLFALSRMTTKDYQPRDAGDHPSRIPEDRASMSLLSSVKWMILSPFLRTVVVVCAVGNFFFQTVILLLVVLAEQQHMSSARLGLLLATSGVGGLAGSVVASKVGKRDRDEWGEQDKLDGIIVLCVVAWAALTFVVALSAWYGQPVIGLISWGGLSVTGGFINVAIVTYQAKQVPEHMIGRVMGINRFLTSGAVPLGSLSAGYIVGELRPHAAAWLVFGVVASMAVVALPILLRPRWLLPAPAIDWLKHRLSPTVTGAPGPRTEASEEPRTAVGTGPGLPEGTPEETLEPAFAQ